MLSRYDRHREKRLLQLFVEEVHREDAELLAELQAEADYDDGEYDDEDFYPTVSYFVDLAALDQGNPSAYPNSELWTTELHRRWERVLTEDRERLAELHRESVTVVEYVVP